jgi:hypothetical protein
LIPNKTPIFRKNELQGKSKKEIIAGPFLQLCLFVAEGCTAVVIEIF